MSKKAPYTVYPGKIANQIVRKQNKEIERLNNIIKEVREYIETKYEYLLGDDDFLDHDELVDRKRMKHILEILDKENINEENK